jgi:hypothetical protein
MSEELTQGLGDVTGGEGLAGLIDQMTGQNASESEPDANAQEPDLSETDVTDGDVPPETDAESAEGEGEADAPPTMTIPAERYNALLGLLAKAGIQLPQDGEGDAPPETQVDTRNAIPGEEVNPEPFDLTEEEMSALCIDEDSAKALSPMFDRVAQRAVKSMENRVAAMTLKAMSESFSRLHVAQQFYDEHPHLEQFGEIVNQTIAMVKAQHPEYRPRQIMGDVKTLLGNLVPKADEMAKQLDAANRGKATGTRSASAQARPSAPRAQSPTEAAILGLSGSGRATDPELKKLGY